jgi:predicted phosphodiesterase
MRLLIYSDVHGNLPAFESVLKDAGNCDGYICLGDLVNYGPWSNECVDLAFSLPNSIFIKGNHENAFINGFYPGNNQLVQKFFLKTFPKFDRIEIISGFLNKYVLGKFTCTHTIQNRNIYPDSELSLDRNYIIGHSHHQFKVENNSYVLYNSGSVGQNRCYINVANYLIYETETNIIDMRYSCFNLKFLLNKMEDLGYPKECIQYYEKKQSYIESI